MNNRAAIKKGINMPGPDNDLWDHLLCGVEHYLNSGHVFYRAGEPEISKMLATKTIKHGEKVQ